MIENQPPQRAAELTPTSNEPGRTELMVDGCAENVTSDHSILFVQHPDGPAQPVLYFKGRRVIRAWSLRIVHEEPADLWGCSG